MFEDTVLYDGDIILRFDSAKHTYHVIKKGKEYKVPSVTTVCGIINKPALIPWAVKQAVELCKGAIAPGSEYGEVYLEQVWDAAKKASQRIKQDAADRGKGIHAAIESGLISGEASSETPFQGAISWFQSIGWTTRSELLERRIYSRRHRYSGTLDCLAIDPNNSQELVLLDWKTGKHVYPEFRLQTAAYVLAWEEEHPDQLIQGRYIVRIAEDGSIEPHFYPRSTLRKDISAFLGAKRLFDRVQEIEKEKHK
jgi:hypothetical protein